MNGDELARNPQLSEWKVADLNKDPRLPYADNSFDVITNCVSVDYLTKPIEVGGSWGGGGTVWFWGVVLGGVVRCCGVVL